MNERAVGDLPRKWFSEGRHRPPEEAARLFGVIPYTAWRPFWKNLGGKTWGRSPRLLDDVQSDFVDRLAASIMPWAAHGNEVNVPGF